MRAKNLLLSVAAVAALALSGCGVIPLATGSDGPNGADSAHSCDSYAAGMGPGLTATLGGDAEFEVLDDPAAAGYPDVVELPDCIVRTESQAGTIDMGVYFDGSTDRFDSIVDSLTEAGATEVDIELGGEEQGVTQSAALELSPDMWTVQLLDLEAANVPLVSGSVVMTMHFPGAAG